MRRKDGCLAAKKDGVYEVHTESRNFYDVAAETSTCLDWQRYDPKRAVRICVASISKLRQGTSQDQTNIVLSRNRNSSQIRYCRLSVAVELNQNHNIKIK